LSDILSLIFLDSHSLCVLTAGQGDKLRQTTGKMYIYCNNEPSLWQWPIL